MNFKDIEKREFEVESLIKLSEIGIWLNEYDDIFSDFDHRPYNERALSDDFLIEIKKASSREENMGHIELRLLIKKEKRDLRHETLIKKRLKNHFKKHYEILKTENKRIRKKGLEMTFAGIIMIGISAYLTYLDPRNFFLRFVETILAAGGWFTGWTGLDQIYYGSRDLKGNLNFYRKMHNATIVFDSY